MHAHCFPTSFASFAAASWCEFRCWNIVLLYSRCLFTSILVAFLCNAPFSICPVDFSSTFCHLYGKIGTCYLINLLTNFYINENTFELIYSCYQGIYEVQTLSRNEESIYYTGHRQFDPTISRKSISILRYSFSYITLRCYFPIHH